MEKVISSKIICETPVFDVEEALVELPDGKQAKRWYSVAGDGVCVICKKGDSYILEREFRSGSGRLEWRIPTGAMEKGETPEIAAIREVREEVGLEPLDLVHFKTMKRPGGYSKQTLHCFVATKFRENPLPSGESEEQHITVHELSEEEVKLHLSHYEFSDAIGVFLADYIYQR